MKRTVEDYMQLPYTIEITPDDGSFFVRVKELQGCISVGKTRYEAFEMIDDAMREWLTAALEDGFEIPLPKSPQEERYSGKFPLRLPKSLHRELAQKAQEDNVSLNQYLVMLLSERNATYQFKKISSARNEHLHGEDANGTRSLSAVGKTS